MAAGMAGAQPDVRHSFWPPMRPRDRPGSWLSLIETRFVLVLDSDAHLSDSAWDVDLITLYQADPRRRLIAAKGGVEKPIHPCFMFFEAPYFKAASPSPCVRSGWTRRRPEDLLRRHRGQIRCSSDRVRI